MKLELIDKRCWQVTIGFAIVGSLNVWNGVVLGNRWQCYYLNDKIIGYESYEEEINYTL